jgi:hypothetical protein
VIFTSSSKTRHTSRCLHQRLLPVGRSGRARARRPQLADRNLLASSSLDPSPLMGLSKDCPFVDIRFERPLPGVRDSARARSHSLPSVGICHLPTRSVLAVPPGFDGLLRSSAAGLLHPAADHGVHYVSSPECKFLRCFLLDCSGLPLALPHHSNGFPVVYDPGSHHGSPFEGFPPSRPCKPLRWSSSEGVGLQRFRECLLRVAASSLRSGFSPIPAPRPFDPSPLSSGVRIRPPKWPDPVPSPHAVTGSPCVTSSLRSTGDCSFIVHFPLDAAPRTRSTSGYSSVMEPVAFDHVAVPEHPVILPWAFVLPAEGATTVCTGPSRVTRFRGTVLEPVVDRSSPNRTRPRRSPKALIELPTLSGSSRFPLNFQSRWMGFRITPGRHRDHRDAVSRPSDSFLGRGPHFRGG